jgi:Fur family ferric uptake transcriptional regulator
MATAQETFKGLLKTAGYSITTARLAVFTALVDQEPMQMHTLVEACHPVDRASVYRAIELFEQLGIVQRIYTGWKYRIELTDTFITHHHHLTCTACGRMVVIGEVELESVIESLSRSHGFTPTAHQIEIQGLCGQCVGNVRN